ncbi:hypothetical protein QC823_14990 [Halomonas vilamensis]|uniref:Uncharacterized protein n=1 Tax=Vreelandella vilamensis TaxID=531309 RepID=A0ABU1H7J5_9GAMM|nr:hypothetical protein [Halomonas vilamensis]MDR5900275.1 hypothetical protein [Halomonas vilamensis]
MSCFVKSFATSLVTACLLASPLVQASVEQLETDLSELFAHGELSIGKVSESSRASRVVAENIVFEGREGERVLVERYVVNGDYEAPDDVQLENMRIEDTLTGKPLLSIESLILDEPGMAVITEKTWQDPSFELAQFAIDGLVVSLDSDVADEVWQTLSLDQGAGQLTIESIQGKSLSASAIGELEFTNMAMQGNNIDELGDVSLIVGRFRAEDVQGLQQEELEQVGAMSLERLTVESDTLAASLALLSMDGDLNDGAASVQVESLELDLNRMIALAPPEERTQMRMVANVLTDGTGLLGIDVDFLARWEEQASQSLLGGDGQIALRDALGLRLNVELPLVLPEGVTPVDVLSDRVPLEDATLLGGEAILTLNDHGLVNRLVTLAATLEGVTEEQVLDVARTQARGYGMVFGPEVEAVLMGGMALLEGRASQLIMSIVLPAESRLDTYADDPLGLPELLSLEVETR